MPTLSEIYEEQQTRTITTRIFVSGQQILFGTLQSGTSIEWSFGWSQAATCTIRLPIQLPSTLTNFSAGSRPPIQVYVGFNGVDTLVFTGVVMDAANNERGSSMSCVGEGRRLEIPYKRTLIALDNTDSETAITSLLTSAGVVNYSVDLTDWTLATVDPITLQFSTYGEAINKIAQVYGSPWYEMPDGQIRVELRDPIPGSSVFRQYFSGLLSGLSDADRESYIAGTLTAADIQPAGVTNSSAWPRLVNIERRDFPRNVRNFVTILGATVQTQESDGTTSSSQIETAAEALSPWIPDPPGQLEVTISNELVDTEAIAVDMALRYVNLYNRLETILSATVQGDPEIFLGATVEVIDPDYSGTTGKWIVYGYQSSLSVQGFTTRLDLRGGGPAAGTTPKIKPFACFSWATTGKSDQVLPVGIGPGGRGIIVTFDGRCSRDPDGSIATYAWSDTEGNSGSGPIISFAYDPAIGSVDVTLTVTDNDGLTDAITKTVNVDATDSEGQEIQDTHIFVAAEEYAMVTSDGGQNWTDITKAAAGVSGDFVAVGAGQSEELGAFALFGTDQGEIVFVNEGGANFGLLDTTAMAQAAHWPSGVAISVIRHVQPEGSPITPVLDSGSWDFKNGWFIGFADGHFVFLYEETSGGILTPGSTDPLESDAYVIQGNLNPPDPPTTAINDIKLRIVPWLTSQGVTEAHIFGGDTSDLASLALYANVGIGTPWESVPITGLLATAIAAAGAGHSVVRGAIELGTRRMFILFGSGVSPRGWFCEDFSNPTWQAAVGLAAATDGMALDSGFLGVEELVVILNSLTSYSATDGIAFGAGGNAPSLIADLQWEFGQSDVYIGAASGGVVKTIDAGAIWGYVRPHVGVATTWPAGAVGRAIAFIGAPPQIPSAELLMLGSANYLRLTSGTWTVGPATPDINSNNLRTRSGGRAVHNTADGASPNVNRISTNEGQTFANITSPAGFEGAMGHDWTSEGRLILVYLDTTPAPDEGQVYYSDNDGAALTALGATWQVSSIVDMACHPTNPNRMAVSYQSTGNLLFVRVSTDAGVNWTNRQVDAGAYTGEYHRLFWLNNSRLVILYELQDGTFKIAYSDDFGQNWTVAYTNATTHLDAAARAGVSGPIVAAVDPNSGLTQGVFLRSIDLGETWEELDSPLPDTNDVRGLDYDAASDRMVVLWLAP